MFASYFGQISIISLVKITKEIRLKSIVALKMSLEKKKVNRIDYCC